MTKESINRELADSAKVIEKTEGSKERIILRRKPSLEQENPPQNGAQRGGSLENLFGSMSISENHEHDHKNTKSEVNNLSFNCDAGYESEFSDIDEAEKKFQMPKPGSPEAPYFDGYDVELFLNNMKSLAIKSSISKNQLASTIPSYCSDSVCKFIRNSFVYRLKEWRSLKEFMMETYKSKEKKTFKVKDLDYLLDMQWNYDTAFSLLNEYKVVANDLIKKKLIMEDVVVNKLSNILPENYFKAGLLAQGDRAGSHMFVSLDESIQFTKKSFRLHEKSKEYNLNNQNKQLFSANKNKPRNVAFEKLCVYCDQIWHPRTECKSLTRDLSNKIIKFDTEGKIVLIDGTPLKLNYGNGGMEKLTKTEHTVRLVSIRNDHGHIFDNQEVERIENSSECEHNIYISKRKPASEMENMINKKQYLNVDDKKYYFDSDVTKEDNQTTLVGENYQSKLIEETMNLTVPISIRQLIKSNPEYRKELSEIIKIKKTPANESKKNEKVKNPKLNSETNYSQINTIKSSNVVKIKGKLSGFPVLFTFDTGAMLNLVSKSVVDNINKNKKILNSKPANYHLKGIYGEYVTTSEEISDCKIEINESVTKAHLIITESDSFEVLLGMPWIRSVCLSSTIFGDGVVKCIINSNVDNKTHSFEVNIDELSQNNQQSLGINALTLLNNFGIGPEKGLSVEQQKNQCLTLYKSTKKKVKPVNIQLPTESTKSPGIFSIINNNKKEISIEEMESLKINKNYLTKEEQFYMKTELVKIKNVFATTDEQMGCLDPKIEPPDKDETFVMPGIRKFVYDHIVDVVNILSDLKLAGLTVSLSKSSFGNEYIDVVGFRCSHIGREPLERNINKVIEWTRPQSLKEAKKMGMDAMLLDMIV
ncbi:hypothetical protein AYI69_g5225 [Smittium culicis]|uniref:Uncharacterized protein n=1 Tax=Smittium culicis TaxID=133412 RepID=A0A1R1Y7U7_9FUNG|nr:hypothetical protein AYI69_g8292 [Smittium culicis]OMJ22875.1 hypothetical protein AYI69_g5225 [Smittium culicis]